jgi:DNA polymerase-1
MLVTKSTLEEVLKTIEDKDVISVDLETTGLNPWNCGKKDDIAGIAVSVNGDGKGYYLPLNHVNSENLSEHLPDILKTLEKSPCIINHNLKFDMSFLYQAGMNTTDCLWIDTQNAAYLMDECSTKALKPVCDRYLSDESSYESQKLEEHIHQMGMTGKGDMWKLPAKDVAAYAIQDTQLAWKLWRYMNVHLPRPIQPLWTELNALAKAAHRMERRGVPTDMEKLVNLESEARKSSMKLYTEIVRNHRGLNPAKPQSIAKYIKAPDSKAETIDAKLEEFPELKLVREFRQWQKAITTYYEPYRLEYICNDKRIRPNFNIIGARSGRWSSNSPNLQNIPRNSERQKVKKLFNSEGDKVFVEVDYSQAEIRLAAHYAKDEALIEAIKRGEDIHSYTAKEAFGEVTKSTRQAAKTLNFAVLYGAGVSVVANKLGTTEKVAKDFLDKYHKRFHYQDAIKEATNFAKNKKAVRMWNGRIRHYSSPEEYPHTAFNQVIQGGVGQMMNRAVVRLDEELPEAGMIMQVHDAVYFEMDRNQVDVLVPEIKRILQYQPQFNVPMTVDVKIGTCLGEMKEYEIK